MRNQEDFCTPLALFGQFGDFALVHGGCRPPLKAGCFKAGDAREAILRKMTLTGRAARGV
jgi:hypothetical protein